ncbi:carboxypeptidase regulatory-like domain-containing protein [Acidobacteria bacterium AB60]|nr:carboxypeptidase regulatory-like domain-containing protein [Acidobacteria bacterium AB60]
MHLPLFWASIRKLYATAIFRTLAAAAITIFLVPPSAFGQYRASIQGTVADPQGGVIPKAKLTLTNTDTNETQTRTTNGEGVYNFNALPPGHFKLVVEAAGFQSKELDNVSIIPEQPNAINVQLNVAAQAQTVTVDASNAPLLDTETATIGGTISENQIQHMPSFGRDVFQLTSLAPGTTGDQSQAAGGGTFSLPGTQGPGGSGSNTGIFATENGPQTLAGGQQYESNGISIDGITTVSAVWGGTSVVTPSEESVDNVKVVSNSYDAENGRFSGAQIQVTSKSGTNTIHGTAFFQAWRPGLNAYQRYNGPASLKPGTPSERGLLKDTQRFNQMGGSIGGPLWKNHVFAFFAYETERNNSSVTSTGWYETPAFDKLAPNGSISSKYLSFPGGGVSAAGLINATCSDAGLSEGVNCITVPGQGLNIGSPLKTPLGTHDPSWQSATNPGVGGGLDPTTADIAEYTTLNPTHVVDQQFNGRLDADVTQKDHATFAIYWVPVDQTYYNGPTRAYNLWHHSAINDAFSGIWNHTFSPTFLNEARANAAGWRWNEIASNPQEPFGLPTDSFGTIGNGTQVQAFGAPGPTDFDQWTYNYKDIATKILRNHSIKFGGELTRLYYLNSAPYAARPTFNFFNVWDFLNDAPMSETGTFDPTTGVPTQGRQDNRENLWGLFVQDDWKVKPSLTVNLGLRYSYFDALSSKENNMFAVRFGSGADMLTGINVRRGGSLWTPQKYNFGPQVGFAWTPGFYHQRVVIRGGFGMNYNQEEIAISANVYGNPGLQVSPNFTMSTPTSPNPGIVYAIPTDVHSLFGYPPNPNTIATFGANGLPATGQIGVTAFRNELPTMYTEHYSLDTETDLGAQFIFSLGYQGNVARHTYFHYDANAVAAARGVPLNPQVNSVNYFDNTGHASYNAMLVGLRHQFSHQFMLDAQLTWGRSMDTSSAPYSEQDYPYDTSLNWGRSDYNITRQERLYGLWQPVFFKGHSWAEKIAGGWSFSGILNVHTGFPWTPIYNSNVGNLYCSTCPYTQVLPSAYLGGAGQDYGNDAYKSGPGVGNGVNKNFPQGGLAYFTPPALTAGPAFPASGAVVPVPGIRRNSWTGPGYRDVDATVTKSFGIPGWKREGAGIEVRADAFNLFNLLNFKPAGSSVGGGVSDNIQSPNFGQATAALGSRTVTLQARFHF